MKTHKNPFSEYSYNWFNNERPEILKTSVNVTDYIAGYNGHTILVAPVKSGKREIAFCIKMLLDSDPEVQYCHWYISSLVRKDEKDQLELFKKHGFKVYLPNNYETVKHEISKDQKSVHIVHFNESDYGTGSKQRLSKSNLWSSLVKNKRVRIICYSATNEEAERSPFANVAKRIKFIPPASYCGAEWYLQQSLVKQATVFYDKNGLTKQGKDCVDLLLTSSKTFGVVRFPIVKGNFSMLDFYRDVENYSSGKVIIKTYGENNPFIWGDSDDATWRALLQKSGETGCKYIICIVQTCTRSTELSFHEHIAFWHGADRSKSYYNTIIQADGRVFHYNNGTKNINIQVFSHVPAFELAAERITLQQYAHKLSGRIKSKTVKQNDLEKRQFIFDRRPTAEEVNQRAKLEGAAIYDYSKDFYSAISKNERIDQAKALINNSTEGTGKVDNSFRVIHVDSPHKNWRNSWNKLMKEKPEYLGKYIVILMFKKNNVTEHKTKLTSVYS